MSWFDAVDQSPMERSVLTRPTVQVAQELVGSLLAVRDEQGILLGRIVEVEAYTGLGDAASHAATRRTGLVSAMWGESGRAYVYTSYGLHTMLNIVAKNEGEVGAVLIRAMEVVAGTGIVRERRLGVVSHRLAAGPGLVCRAFAISREDHGEEMIRGPRFALFHGDGAASVHAGNRIGINRATELPWRFFDAGSRAVSAHRRGISVNAAGGR